MAYKRYDDEQTKAEEPKTDEESKESSLLLTLLEFLSEKKILDADEFAAFAEKKSEEGNKAE